MKRLQTIAKHLVQSEKVESEKHLHVCDRLLKIAESNLTPMEFSDFKDKFIDFRQDPFPEVNPINMRVQQEGREISIANYRYPCMTHQRKGIVYFVHGYGEYVQRYGYLGKIFAHAGYDFVGIDQRGFGYSEGTRALVESEEIVIKDLMTHIDLVDQKYGGANVQKFIIGFSLGGLLTTKINSIRPHYFSAMALMAPFFGFLHKDKFDKYKDVLEELQKTDPTKKLMLFPMKPLPPEHVLHFIVDPLNQTRDVCARNVWELNQAPSRLTDKMIDNIYTPMIMFLGGIEQVVDNKESLRFFEKCSMEDKKYITYMDQDHMIFHDRQQLQEITSRMLEFFEKYIK